jgi:hypothetical protein
LSIPDGRVENGKEKYKETKKEGEGEGEGAMSSVLSEWWVPLLLSRGARAGATALHGILWVIPGMN